MTGASGVCVRCGEDEATHLGFTRPATCGTFEASKPCDRCKGGSFTDSNGIVRRCWFCNGTGVVKA